jgi:glycosyltransferase involved in cell wall biosynthesis
MRPNATVIIRAKNKGKTIENTLKSLRLQTAPCFITVIDSGSRDNTVEIARKYADNVIEISPSQFSYGGTLNLGSENAKTEFIFSLSAHCVVTNPKWIQTSVAQYKRDDVAATNGSSRSPYGEPIAETWFQTIDDVKAVPRWGFSNHASSWRKSVWLKHQFHEDLNACEDKEWSWRVLADGHTIAYRPDLFVIRPLPKFKELLNKYQRDASIMVQMGGFKPGIFRRTFHLLRNAPINRASIPRYWMYLNPKGIAMYICQYKGERMGWKLLQQGQSQIPPSARHDLQKIASLGCSRRNIK